MNVQRWSLKSRRKILAFLMNFEISVFDDLNDFFMFCGKTFIRIQLFSSQNS